MAGNNRKQMLFVYMNSVLVGTFLLPDSKLISDRMRHWFSTAEEYKFSRQNMKNIIDEAFDNMDVVIKQVSSNITGIELDTIGSYIFKGMQQLKDSVVKSRG